MKFFDCLPHLLIQGSKSLIVFYFFCEINYYALYYMTGSPALRIAFYDAFLSHFFALVPSCISAKVG